MNSPLRRRIVVFGHVVVALMPVLILWCETKGGAAQSGTMRDKGRTKSHKAAQKKCRLFALVVGPRPGIWGLSVFSDGIEG
jgi:hypothetical protein